LRAAHAELPRALREAWVWWHLPAPCMRRGELAEVIEPDPTGVEWHTNEETKRLLRMMSRANLRKVGLAGRIGRPVIGTVYRRTRPSAAGRKVQRAEVRFDQISGCLRTPVGGSSRQTVIIVNKERVQTRLLSPREAARLMGVPDNYPLPCNYNDAYHLFGDGVAVPVVSWLENHLLWPLAVASRSFERVA
jgi:DNA (cytosine-5)-methyltransferase 1